MKSKLVVASLLALLAPASVARAADPRDGMPNPEDPSIVVPRSLGGIAIGDNLQDANRAWGNRDRCSRGVCSYGSFSGRQGAARIIRVDGGVGAVQIVSGIEGPKEDVFEGPLLRFETPEGIGLGSKLSELRRAYPEATPTPGAGRGLQVEGRGSVRMTFETYRSKENRITEILLTNDPLR